MIFVLRCWNESTFYFLFFFFKAGMAFQFRKHEAHDAYFLMVRG